MERMNERLRFNCKNIKFPSWFPHPSQTIQLWITYNCSGRKWREVENVLSLQSYLSYSYDLIWSRKLVLYGINLLDINQDPPLMAMEALSRFNEISRRTTTIHSSFSSGVLLSYGSLFDSLDPSLVNVVCWFLCLFTRRNGQYN